MENANGLLSRRQAAQLLGVSTRTFSRLENDGRLPARVQVSARIYGYRSTELHDFLAALPVVGPPKTVGRPPSLRVRSEQIAPSSNLTPEPVGGAR